MGIVAPLRAAAIQRLASDSIRARAASAASACDMAVSIIVLPLAGFWRSRWRAYNRAPWHSPVSIATSATKRTTRSRTLGPSGMQAFAFTPSGGWVIVTNGGLFARNIPEECYQKLLAYVGDGHKIRVIAFPPEGGNRWLIVTDRTYFARNIPDECYDRLGVMWNAGARPTCVAFPSPGGNRWAILAGKSLYCRNIDDECYQLLCNYGEGLRPAVRVAFTPQNGWVILARDRFFARRIPDECYDKMREIGQSWEIDHVNFEFDGGWSIISNTGRTALATDPLRELEGHIVQIGGDWKSITERMAAYKVPGVTMALVRNNQVWWATTYGRVEAGSADWVHADTVFQAASCSKPIAGIGYLRLVQDGLIGLDEGITGKLEWNLPRRSCAPASWEAKVTLRRLLRHRGGIIGRDATNPQTSCSNFDQRRRGRRFRRLRGRAWCERADDRGSAQRHVEPPGRERQLARREARVRPGVDLRLFGRRLHAHAAAARRAARHQFPFVDAGQRPGSGGNEPVDLLAHRADAQRPAGLRSLRHRRGDHRQTAPPPRKRRRRPLHDSK